MLGMADTGQKMESNHADVFASRVLSNQKGLVASSAISPGMAAKTANVGNGHRVPKAGIANAATHDDAADPHYEANKRSYEIYQSWTGLVGSIARCFGCSLELIHLRHASNHKRQQDEPVRAGKPGQPLEYHWGLPQFLQVLCGLAQLGSRITFCQLNTLKNSKSARLRKEHDELLNRLVLGNIAATVTNFFGTAGVMLPDQIINEIGMGLMCGSTLFDIWVLKWPSSGIHSESEAVETISEMIASVSGVVTVGASYYKDYETGTIGCGVNAFCTLVAVAGGIVHLVHLVEH